MTLTLLLTTLSCFSSVFGLRLNVKGFSNISHPLSYNFFSIDGEFFVHQVCLDEYKSKVDLNELDEKSLEKEQRKFSRVCDIKTKIPLESFIQIISEGPYSAVTISDQRLVHEKKRVNENVLLLQKSSDSLTKEFWNVIAKTFENRNFSQTNFSSDFLNREPLFGRYLVQLSWDYSTESTSQGHPMGLIRKIRNENMNRVHPIYSETKGSFAQWTLILLDSYRLKETDMVRIKDIDLLTCEKVFGLNWRTPSYEEIRRNYKELLDTKLFNFVKGNEIWVSDQVQTEDNEALNSVYRLDKKKLLVTNHQKRLKSVEDGYKAYRVCYCSTDKNKKDCAF